MRSSHRDLWRFSKVGILMPDVGLEGGSINLNYHQIRINPGKKSVGKSSGPGHFPLCIHVIALLNPSKVMELSKDSRESSFTVGISSLQKMYPLNPDQWGVRMYINWSRSHRTFC